MPKPKIPRILTILCITLAFFLVPIYQKSNLFSQNQFENAKKDYAFHFLKYNDQRQKLSQANSSYNTFKTVAAKNDLFIATRDYLLQINNLYIAYINTVIEYSNEINWSKLSEKRAHINQKLESEKQYFRTHQPNIQNVTTLEELPPLSDDLRKYIEEQTKPAIYMAFITYEMANIQSTDEEFEQLLALVKTQLNLKLQSGENTTISNWFSEINSIQQTSNTYLDGANAKFENLDESVVNRRNLNEILQDTSTTKNELKKSINLFEEVLQIL
ncbi:hypothetical protein A3F02_03080 [Candidatus Curtissbacteria bacterium RIFCSPHIGHO2_12_FULL_38_9b]|uniref:Uncharacterized protein n=2 Tax=Candidatus Curtissiibacteriota TaxID=1752717 RepID=A0A1F5GZ39_9BACT|nr:MAG: hypothetical protein A3A48_00950 [Candidatus Curtissbacteria bacterium RIFCSPLOWO2_01_FULL_37_9]OGD97156.1 MAG: hypothetical protein A3F02_03080 [Candidatus Curtissbacteria bacterium RIFCSPHIGHO2_12_FULL_38_9b]